MAEDLIVSYSSPSVHSIDLSVSVSGLTFTVDVGSILYTGSSYTLASPEVHTVGSYAATCIVTGYLVLDTANSGSLRVFVDEYVQDGVDIPYSFDSPSSAYTLLSYLYNVSVPPGTTDISGLPWQHWKIVAG